GRSGVTTYWLGLPPLAACEQRIEPRRRHRIFADAHAERRKRVLDRRDNRARSRHAAGLADPFDAERVEGRREYGERHLDLRHLGGARDEIVGERGGEGLRLIVVTHPFV